MIGLDNAVDGDLQHPRPAAFMGIVVTEGRTKNMLPSTRYCCIVTVFRLPSAKRLLRGVSGRGGVTGGVEEFRSVSVSSDITVVKPRMRGTGRVAIM